MLGASHTGSRDASGRLEHVGGRQESHAADRQTGRTGGRKNGQTQRPAVLQRHVQPLPLALAPSAVRGRGEALRSGERKGRRPKLLDYAR
jgi:hypothetical protein